jgi:hypothetical protein
MPLLKRPKWRGHMGMPWLFVFSAVAVVGLVLLAAGAARSSTGLRGGGLMLVIVGGMFAGALLIRWLVYWEIG